jgi:hypothetical protein
LLNSMLSTVLLEKLPRYWWIIARVTLTVIWLVFSWRNESSSWPLCRTQLRSFNCSM